jgi:hypothetical protein
MALFYYKYNNYNNRRLKREDTLQGYSNYLVYTEVNPNFNPGDGVSTQITVGRDQNAYASNADYVIYSETGTNITSRWFIMESHFNRSGQYIINLYRDVVADFYNEILNADTFIEKATLPDSSPLIFNKENIGVNQIKKHEELIKDESGAAWIVGYLDRKYEGGTLSLASVNIVPDVTVDTLDGWNYFKYTNYSSSRQDCYGFVTAQDFLMEVVVDDGTAYQTWKNWESQPLTSSNLLTPATSYVSRTDDLLAYISAHATELNSVVDQYKNLYTTKPLTPVAYNDIKNLNGKILYDTNNNKYYKIYTQFGIALDKSDVNEDKSGQYLYTYLNNTFNTDALKISGGNPTYRLDTQISLCYMRLEEVTGTISTHTVEMPSPANRLHCKDAPFDMFCIPFVDNKKVNNSATTFGGDMTTNKIGYLAMVQSIAQQLGANLYDLQLLPFSPVTGINYYSNAGGDQFIDLNTNDLKRYTIVKDTSGVNYMPLIWCTASSGNLTTATYCGPRGQANRKVDNECKMYRIVSGNYSATFEYNPEKFMTNAAGAFTGLNVDFTYLPYQPFIRIAPKFTGLYGEEFHDARGLIASAGDFSLMYLSDAWVNYKTQNKNFQQIFDRGIKSMEFQNSITNQNNEIQAIVGALSGATTGALAGASVGGVAGGIIGAVGGGAASAIGGIQDIKNTKALQAEAIDYKQDLFGYQLGNVKALPNSIAKSTAYNIINKVFPIIEFYDCTEEERAIVAKKIAWNGMTVMAIGRIADYVGNSWTCKVNDNTSISDKGYIKGQLIRLESDNIDDAHLQTTIIEEINKGWYFK